MEVNKKNSIHKFLNSEMSSEEEELFKKSTEYQKHQKVIALFDDVTTIPFDKEKVLHNINKEKLVATKKVIPLYKKWLPLSIAASILILCSLFYTYATSSISYNTSVGESIQVSLPDDSSIWLNAKSKIAHNKNWKESRNIELDGEAYFEVAKGKTFTVNTSEGIVTVLGTKFNVKERNDYFEVHCFEGAVAVVYKNVKTVLKPNEFFTSKKAEKQHKPLNKPNWMLKKSIFSNANFQEVVSDISIQYDVDFSLDKKLEKTQLKYTGSYNYSDDLKTVLEVFCQSLNLEYTINNTQVNLTTVE